MDYSELSKNELIEIINFLNGMVEVQAQRKEKLLNQDARNYKIDSTEVYWKTILDSIPMVVFLNDSDSCLWVNKECFKVSGYTSEEWVSMTTEERSMLFDFSGVQEISIVGHYDKEGISPENNNVSKIYKMKKKDGNWIWVYSTFSYIFDPMREDFIAMGTAIDITDRKNKEQQIESLNKILKETLEREKQLAEENKLLLQRELEEKTRELTRLALILTDKQNCLIQLKKLVASISSEIQVDIGRMSGEIISSIESNLNNESVWDTFKSQFETVNPNFLKNLLSLSRDLTTMELRICSLIKLRLSSKAISAILSISPRTVDTHRFNIRKKLSLVEKAPLSKFLNSFEL